MIHVPASLISPLQKTSLPNITQSALKVMSTHHVHKTRPTTKLLQFLLNFNEKLLNFLKLTPHGETQQLLSVFRMKKTHRPTSSFPLPLPLRCMLSSGKSHAPGQILASD